MRKYASGFFEKITKKAKFYKKNYEKPRKKRFFLRKNPVFAQKINALFTIPATGGSECKADFFPERGIFPFGKACILLFVKVYYSGNGMLCGRSRQGFIPVEESPDCTEQGVLLLKKDAADDIPR